jgi:hypothetical protein
MKTKIDRVIMALTNNQNYIGFWNYTSKIWKTKFGITPTLFFYGTIEEMDNLNFSKEYGEIFLLPRCESVTACKDLDWACTWGLFYGASKFTEDICMLVGIDQIPLNTYFFDQWKNIENVKQKYVIGFSDAYADPDNLPNGVYFPSSHHIACGQKFREIYDINENWFLELTKVYSLKNNYYIPSSCGWGLDEAHSATILNQRRRTHGDVYLMKIFQSYWKHHRLDRSNMNQFETVNIEDIKNKKYCEFHAARPFEANNQVLMEKIYEAIPSMEW